MRQISTQEVKMTLKYSLNTVLEKYYKINLKVFQLGSDIKDIDKVFDFFTEYFT